jgi:hypothetical protein
MTGVNVISSLAVSYSDATIDQMTLTLQSVTLVTVFQIYEASCPIPSTFKLEVHLNKNHKLSSNLTKNTMCLHYEGHPVNTVQEYNRCFF